MTARAAVPFDPVLSALERAPVGRAVTPEQIAELDQQVADIAAGRARLVPHADVQAMLEERRRRQVDCEACRGEGEAAGATCVACAGSGGFCKTCGKSFAACIEANACEPPGAPWAARKEA